MLSQTNYNILILSQKIYIGGGPPNKEAFCMHISITVRDQILLIETLCAAHLVWMTADVIYLQESAGFFGLMNVLN